MRERDVILFQSNLESIVKGYDNSYDHTVSSLSFEVVQNDNAIEISQPNQRTIDSKLLQIVDAASRHMCAVSYYVDYDTVKGCVRIRIF